MRDLNGFTWLDRRRADVALLWWHVRFGAKLTVAELRGRCVVCRARTPQHELDCGWRD